MALQSFLLSLAIVSLAARVMGSLALRIGQPAVLGELFAGVLIGGHLLGWVEATGPLTLLGDIGVMLLLFEIGLESDLPSFLRVGKTAALVATIGVAAPFALGYLLGLALHLSQVQSIFIGATLTATSIAISARTLAELGRLRTDEGQVILGAAVIDDILGLLILSVLLGLSTSGTVSWLNVGRTAGVACVLLAAAILVGTHYADRIGRLLNLLRIRGSLIVAAVAFALGLGYLAGQLHIAPLLGSFAAGLMLARTEHQAHIGEAIKPVAGLFVPIFFVLVGMAVDLRFLNPLQEENQPVLFLAGGLLVVATLGKLAAGFGVVGKRADPWLVGIGMLPRGEVGLIFAGTGLAQRIIGEGEYGAILAVVAVTTFLTPVLLKWRGRSLGP